MDDTKTLSINKWKDVWTFRGKEKGSDQGKASDVEPCEHHDLDAPLYAVSQVVGFIRPKSTNHVTRVYGERRCSFWLTARLAHHWIARFDHNEQPRPRHNPIHVGQKLRESCSRAVSSKSSRHPLLQVSTRRNRDEILNSAGKSEFP